MSGLRVALVDDHRLLAQALALALRARGHEALCCCQVERSKLSPEWLNRLLNENDKH